MTEGTETGKPGMLTQDPEAAWVLVPREPDGEMDVAGEAMCDKHIQMTEGRYPVGLHSKVYRAMIAAAPKPPRPPAVAELVEEARKWLADGYGGEVQSSLITRLADALEELAHAKG